MVNKNEGNDLILDAWEEQKEALRSGIDEAIQRGKVDRDVLYIMKELLDEGIVRPRKKTIEEYFDEQEHLNKK